MSAPTLSDAPVKPAMRGVLHSFAVFAAAVAGALLVAWAPTWQAKAACAVYAFSLAGLLGTSALYHRVNWSPAARQRMRRLDHAMIFVLIAGTFTPLALTLEPDAARNMLVVAWAAAVFNVLRALFWITAPKWLVAVLALATGYLGLIYLPAIHRVAGPTLTIFMAIGGVAYSAGALCYAFQRPRLWPRVFGYHELFHALVVLAAAAHFAAVVEAMKVVGR